MALKILLNSLYGAMASRWFRYFDANIAEGITLSGQLAIRWAEKNVNGFMQKLLKTEEDYILAIDTDSVYVHMGDVVTLLGANNKPPEKITKALDTLVEAKIIPLLEDSYDKLQTILNARSQKMVMAREIIASKMVFTGKKKYLAHVLNNEGIQYDKPKLKIVGIESVRSSTPQFCRSLIEKTLELIMISDESTIQKFIESHRQEFYNLQVEDIAFPRGVHGIKKYSKEDDYIKGTPMHVRACILYNKYLKEYKLTNKFEAIQDDDKIRFCYLKTPNPIQENVIAFPVVLPKELGLSDYIDYKTQYNKTYIEPIKTIMEAIGWSVDKKNTLEDFFT